MVVVGFTPENPPQSRNIAGQPPPIVYIEPMPRVRLAANLAVAFARSAGAVAPLVVLAAIAGLASSALAQSFTLIGYPEPPFTASRAYALSADGRSATGYTSGIGTPAFLWTAAGGREDIGRTFTGVGQGLGISGDGLTVVGGIPNSADFHAFRWTRATGAQNLGTRPGYSKSIATDTNHDGSIVVGTLSNGEGSEPQAFRWTQATGMQGLGFGTRAHAISGDGSTIVGEFGTAPLGFIWTSSGGTQFLQGLSGSNEGVIAQAINHDGSIVVGRSGPFTAKTTLWINGVPTELPNTLPSAVFTPRGVSDSGNVVAGIIQSPAIPGTLVAGVWTSSTNTLTLSDYLTANGVTIPTGVVLKDCTAVSADGRTFVGWTSGSQGAQGFVATIPTPCPADLDNDGLLANGGTRDRAVTIDDLLYLLAAFESGNLAADLDNGSNTGTRDNAVTIEDLLYFLVHFEVGC